MIDITGALADLGVAGPTIIHNATPAALYRNAILEGDCDIADSGALIARSGKYTGRVPKAKRIVESPANRGDIWWGEVNIPFTEDSFRANRELATGFLARQRHLYVVDGYIAWEKKYQLKVRVICARAYHALFIRNMMVRPTEEQLRMFGKPDWVIYNAGQRSADPSVEGVDSDASVALNFNSQEIVILGTQYAGEMKKGLFTVLNYLLPKEGDFPMHCSANQSKSGECALFFGLSGTGKTTLSADPERELIGDDEHGWWDGGVFNFEGGCYAKTIGLTEEREPQIWNAIKFGSVLENVTYDLKTHIVDYHDTELTQNTRVSYPLEFISNVRIPATGWHPRNVVFLTCDAFGVLPPVARLTTEQAMYHFISGYTAKVAGTEAGITEPKATFSTCYAMPFLVWHPTVYAGLLKEKIEAHGATVWLVNTGWTSGPFGVGHRIPLDKTRAIVSAILDGRLTQSTFVTEEYFGLHVPEHCPDVEDELLQPVKTWDDPEVYAQKAHELARLFHRNFEKYAEVARQETIDAGPAIGR